MSRIFVVIGPGFTASFPVGLRTYMRPRRARRHPQFHNVYGTEFDVRRAFTIPRKLEPLAPELLVRLLP